MSRSRRGFLAALAALVAAPWVRPRLPWNVGPIPGRWYHLRSDRFYLATPLPQRLVTQPTMCWDGNGVRPMTDEEKRLHEPLDRRRPRRHAG